MRSHLRFHNRRMLAIVGEALLNVGTTEYNLTCSIPQLQSIFGMPVAVCYRKPLIPSLGDQREPCLKLRDKVHDEVAANSAIYGEQVRDIDLNDEVAIGAMCEFVKLADTTEIVYLELDLIVRLIDELHGTRNDLIHSLKLECAEGLIVTTASRPATIISQRQLEIFSRKSRQAVDVSSTLLVASVGLSLDGEKLYSSFNNGSYNSRFLKRLYREAVTDLSSKWQSQTMTP